MRLTLKIVNPTNQKCIQRLRFDPKDGFTDTLLQNISQKLQVSIGQFIATIQKRQKGDEKLRIIPKWQLAKYEIANGDEIEVQIVKKNWHSLRGNVNAIEVNGKRARQYIIRENSLKNQFEPIAQQQQQEHDSEDERESNNKPQQTQQDRTCKLLDEKHDRVLKIIQRKNYSDFVQALQFKEVQGQCERMYMKQRLVEMLSDLGSGGWAAIHIAVYCRKIQILRELIQCGVNLNKKTADQWLPIQLAINDYSATNVEEEQQILDLLLAAPFIDLNIVTEKGSALHNALASGNSVIVKKLLSKNLINPYLKDKKGHTFHDMTTNQESKNFLKQYNFVNQEEHQLNIAQPPQIKQYQIEAQLFRGEVYEIRNFPMKPKPRYLMLDSFSGTMVLYKERKDYPKHPRQVISLLTIVDVIKKPRQKRSKKQNIFSRLSTKIQQEYYCFIVTHKKDKKMEFGCNFQQTLNKWVRAFDKTVKCSHILENNPQKVNKSSPKQTTIMDNVECVMKKVATQPQKLSPKKNYGSIMQTFLKGYQNHQIQKKNTSKLSLQMDKSNSRKPSPNSQASSSGGSQTNSSVKVTPKDMKAIRNSINLTSDEAESIKYKDFKLMNLLGQGSFGSVYLARHQKSKKQFALKVFQKKKLLIQKQVRFAASEVSILKQINHPFVMNLHFTFQTPNYIYLGIDYCPGKDLSYHLVKQLNFQQEECRFYAAQILLALQHLHEKNILYRDMKPENILLDGQGHIKVTDFGLSKQCLQDSRAIAAKSFCGSPAYLSPEMVAKKGASKVTDYYGLGAVMYQMIVGEPPYFDQDIKVLYRNIAEGKLKFPKKVSSQAKSLMSALLERNPDKRLGAKGIHQIKNHPFFAAVQWQKVLNKEIQVPYRPGVKQSQSLSQSQIDQLANITKHLHSDKDYDTKGARVNKFLNFSFQRDSCFQL